MNCDFAVTGEVHKKSGRQMLRCQRPGCRVFGLMPPSGNPANLINVSGCEAIVGDTGHCRHLGDSTRQQECDSCAGKTRIKIFACAIHGECTLGKKLEGLACCSGCGEWRAQGGVTATA